jgi:hypothetical protein
LATASTQPDRVRSFVRCWSDAACCPICGSQGAQAAVKKIVGMFDELQFYLGEGEEAFSGQIVLSFWKEGADAPSFWFIKDGLEEEKC